MIHSFSCQDLSSKSNSGHAKGGKAEQNTTEDGGIGSVKKDNTKKSDVRQDKDATTAVVNWAFLTHFRPELAGEDSIIDTQKISNLRINWWIKKSWLSS